MSDQMVQIIEACLRLDNLASRIYRQLSAGARSDHLQSFWRRISDQNEQNVFYWNQLRTWAGKGMMDGLFKNPEQVLQQVRRLEKSVRDLPESFDIIQIPGKAFRLAFKLEFFLLHPIFQNLLQYFQAMTSATAGASPYDRHVNALFEALHENGLGSLELELPAGIMHSLWLENRKLAVQNPIDELTGILNRRGLFVAVNQLAQMAQRNDSAVGLLMIDIDRIKSINGDGGHNKGDAVIKRVAEAIRANIRASDIAGRYGGEEFLVFLTRIQADGLRTVAEKIHQSATLTIDAKPESAVSIGGACDRLGRKVEQAVQLLIQLAESNLRRAKAAGGNCVQIS